LKISYEVAKGNLETLILHTLQAQPQTAYQLIKNLQEKLDTFFSAGTIYTKLYKLQRQGSITQDGEAKFAITNEGKQKLKHNKTSITLMLKILEIGI